MKSPLLYITSAALFVARVSTQSTLTINTPAVATECEPLLITWSGGTGPYFLVRIALSAFHHFYIHAHTFFSLITDVLHPGASPSAAALITFGTVNGTSFTWSAVNEQANTSLDLAVSDSTGATSQSAPFTVQAGTSTSCLNTTATGTGASAVSTPNTGTTTTSSGSSPAPSGTTPTTTKPSSSSTSSTTSTSNAATPNDVSYGVAGVLGAFIAALLV
ncbi:hypothetical protein EI94DRAFT_1795303 [Lactarius quietus]|nr:hypothetical protein EI94DRAFT_1795303 [Lactarius quietus]